MAYIDVEKFNNEILDRIFDVFKKHKTRFNIAEVQTLLQNTPTADVVEVVRCKDCIYKHTAESIPLTYCKVLSLGIVRPVIIEDNDFCSFGKRKEVDE